MEKKAKEQGVKNGGITRRDCLVLLGTGAATLGAATVGATTVGARLSESSGEGAQIQADEIQPSTTPAQHEVLQELDKLKAQLVYADTPVELRQEYADGGAGDGKAWQISLREDWDLAEADNGLPPGRYSEQTAWVRVTMPRPVQYALMEAGKISNLWYADNYQHLQWIQKRDWYLRRRFTIPKSWSGLTIRLRFDGMDYRGMVWLDGVFLGAHEGMFGGPTLDITSRVKPGREQELLVRLLHEEHDIDSSYNLNDRKGIRRAVKPDWIDAETYEGGNHYRTIGLYQPIRLVATGQAYMEAPFVRTDSIGSDEATLWGQAMITNTGMAFEGVVAARIIDLSNHQVVWQEKTRQKVAAGDSFWERRIRLKEAKLWWPNGMGNQPLYRLELHLHKGDEMLDSISSRFGVRTLEMQRNAVDPDSPRSQVTSYVNSTARIRETHEDEAFRYLWVVNGRPFYAKGTCWVLADDVLALTPQREEWMIRAARLNGTNLFRLNGGASILETEDFYHLCDENGIIVWQELPLSAVKTSLAPLEVWREQLRQGVLRFRQHPSTGVYVGGNEFDAYGEGIEPLLGVAREIFAGYDGGRPFRMASPSGGDSHAYRPWPEIFTGDLNWYHKIYGRGHCFISEWSYPAFANVSLLKRILPTSELDTNFVGYDEKKFLAAHPIFRDRVAELDLSAILLWNPLSTYGDLGKATIPELVDYSQMAQAYNYGYVFEQWRAQFPFTGGQTVWTYNSLGPVAESWHYIDWFGQPQVAYYHTKRANEPVHVMADTGFLSWGPGDTFQASVFALNDAEKALEGARVVARILDRRMQPVHENRWTLTVPGGGYKSEPHELTWPIPADTPESYFFLELVLINARGVRLSHRVYWLRVLKMLADPAMRQKWQSAPVAEPLSRNGPWLKPQVAELRTSLTVRGEFKQTSPQEAEVTVDVRNTGKKPAFPVRLEVNPDTYSVLWTDNYFWLAPGEEARVQGTVRLDMNGLDLLTNPPVAKMANLAVEVSAWNAARVSFQA